MKVVQKELQVIFRLGVTGQNKPAAVTGGEADIDHLNRGEFFEDGAWCEAGSIGHRAILQCHLQTIGQKGDENVRIDAIFLLVIDRADIEFAFQ